MRTILALLLVLSYPALAFDNFRGGKENDGALRVMYAREALGRSPISPDGGWYLSRDTVYVASPLACIVRGTDVQALFHAQVVPGGGMKAVTRDSPWNGVVPEAQASGWYRAHMQRSPWGSRIYAYVLSAGWLDTPELHTLHAQDLIALGVPVCR